MRQHCITNCAHAQLNRPWQLVLFFVSFERASCSAAGFLSLFWGAFLAFSMPAFSHSLELCSVAALHAAGVVCGHMGQSVLAALTQARTHLSACSFDGIIRVARGGTAGCSLSFWWALISAGEQQCRALTLLVLGGSFAAALHTCEGADSRMNRLPPHSFTL